MKNNSDKIIIFDTTLRDGEQSPGASLNVDEKIEIAYQLARLGVDVIEAGFPITSPGDFEAVSQIAKKVKGPEICALARCVKGDVDVAWNAVKHSKKPRIHTFIATSDIHLEKKLKMSRNQVLDKIAEIVTHASKYCESIDFSPEDAVRSDFTFLVQAVKTAIEAGATTINVPDTVGYAVPFEFGLMIKQLITQSTVNKPAVFSVHCHNDLGLSVSNSLSAVINGARQIECTINGIGERAGNASLEEIVMALNVRKDFFGLKTNIKTEEIYRTSRLVSRLTGMVVQPNKAIVGANAFSHESGIHQDGVMKHRQTYEIMTPESVGVPSSQLILGKLSGRAALAKRMKDLGYDIDGKELVELFDQFKVLADKKKYIFDEDLLTLVEEKSNDAAELWKLDYLQTSSGTGIVPTATVRLSKSGTVFQEAACGDGPVDAVYKAIDKITKVSAKLLDYKLAAVSGGKDAQGEVTVQLEYAKGFTVRGKGASTDIIEASAKAYISAVNRISLARGKKAIPVTKERV
ncbi:MAG: 2-isopropylmalate synthase [Elusimicrobiota bacterium]